MYLGTSYLTRLFWRRLLLAYTASLLATDASALIMPVLLNNDGATTSGDYADILGLLQPLVDNLQPLPRTVGMLRYTAFTCMLVAVLLYQRTTPTTEQRLARVLAMDEANTLTGKNQQMQDMAVMEDGVLLKHVAAFHTKRQEEAERVRADPMVVKAKSEAQDGTRSNQTARSRSRSHKSSARSADAASDADISG